MLKSACLDNSGEKMTENSFPAASFGRRFLAVVIDFFALATANRFLTAIFPFPLEKFLIPVVSLGYGPLLLYLSGATLGKIVLHLRVVPVGGGKLTVFQVLLREWVGKFLSWFFLGLGFLWSLWDHQHQAWHDKLAETQVVFTGK